MSPRLPARPALLTVAEAARYLSWDEREVRRNVNNGRIASVRLPSRTGNGAGPIRIEQAALDQFIKDCRQPA